MMTAAELKLRLQEIADNDYQLPTLVEAYPLALAMGVHVGAPDPVLRDELIYTTFATWLQRGVLQPKELLEVLGVMLNDGHLFFHLGESGTDSVFTRSFSVLIVAEILGAHNQRPFIPEIELQVIARKLLRYLSGEADLRGYVPQKGWAHAIAHAADALAELVQDDSLDAATLSAILDAIRAKATTPETVYICEEDERLVTAVVHVWQRPELDDGALVDWLAGFIPTTEDVMPMPASYQRFVNSKQFLRSLNARIAAQQVRQLPLQTAVADTLAYFERFT